VVPKSLQHQLLTWAHDAPTGGHFGKDGRITRYRLTTNGTDFGKMWRHGAERANHVRRRNGNTIKTKVQFTLCQYTVSGIRSP